MAGKVNSSTISVKKLVYAVVTDADPETFGTVTEFSPLINIKVTPKISSATQYADGQAVDSISAVGDIAVELETQDMALETQAEILGHTLDPITGIMVCNIEDIAPFVAIGYQRVKANGKSRYVWIRKVKFQVPAEEGATKGENVVFQTPKITGVGVADSHGDWKTVADEDAGTTPPTVAFLATVPATATAVV